MKQHLIARVSFLVSLAGLMVCAIAASAQPVTGDTILDNLASSNITAYPSWTAAGITSGPGGTEATSTGGFGSLYYAVPASQLQTLAPYDVEATLVMTVNSPSASAQTSDWLGIPFILNDSTGAVTYGGYAGEYGYFAQYSPATVTWNGNTVTETVPLTATQIAAIQTGSDTIYGFNLELDPAVLAGGVSAYDVTFDSLTLVPEPSSIALFALGAAAFIVRRRMK